MWGIVKKSILCWILFFKKSFKIFFRLLYFLFKKPKVPILFFHSCEDTVFLKDLDQIFKDRGNISLIRYKDPQSLEYIKEIAFLATNKTGLVITFF